MNLNEGINKVLRENKRKPEEVEHVIMYKANSNNLFVPCQVDVKRFMEIAKMINYDEAANLDQVPQNLMIVGKNFWLQIEDKEGGGKTLAYRTVPETNVPKVDLMIRWNEAYQCWEFI